MITVYRRNSYRRNSEGSQTPPGPRRHLPRLAVLAAAISLLSAVMLPAGTAVAQQAGTPDRIGNTWDGFDHQPTQSQVQSAERASSVAPSAQEQRREAQIVQQLDEKLLGGPGP